MTATGGNAPVNAPTSRPPRVSLIDAATEPQDETDGRWLAGFAFRPEACAGGGVSWDCIGDAGAAPAEETVAADEDLVTVQPVRLWHGDRCTPGDLRSRDFTGRATRALLAREAALIEAELWDGAGTRTADLGNNYLTNPDSPNLVELRGGSPTPALYALGMLQRELPDYVTGPGMIHCPRDVFNVWLDSGRLTRQGNVWFDAFDNRVVPGEGYTGSGVREDNGDANPRPADDLAWVYATSQVHIRRDPAVTLDPPAGQVAAALNRDTNLVTWRASKLAAVYWDGCAHLAIQVDLCQLYCTAGS